MSTPNTPSASSAPNASSTPSASSATSPSAESLDELSMIALAVAEEAAALVMAGHRSRPHADKKGRSDLVTEFDRASEDLLMRRLTKLAPGIPIVGEEQTSQRHEIDVARPGSTTSS